MFHGGATIGVPDAVRTGCADCGSRAPVLPALWAAAGSEPRVAGLCDCQRDGKSRWDLVKDVFKIDACGNRELIGCSGLGSLEELSRRVPSRCR